MPFDRGDLGEDGDAALALEVAGIQCAFGHALVFANRAGLLQQAVDQGGLAMVDMGDDGDVAKHGCAKPIAGPEGPLRRGNIVGKGAGAMEHCFHACASPLPVVPAKAGTR
jgi:hypothetical protein